MRKRKNGGNGWFITTIVVLSLTVIGLVIGLGVVLSANARLNKILDVACAATRTEREVCRAGVEFMVDAPEEVLNLYQEMYRLY